jgi:hypothetical protein
MTTSNAIETNTVKNALYVPLEAVAVDGTTPFVFKRDGARVTKQQVETGSRTRTRSSSRRGSARTTA